MFHVKYQLESFSHLGGFKIRYELAKYLHFLCEQNIAQLKFYKTLILFLSDLV